MNISEHSDEHEVGEDDHHDDHSDDFTHDDHAHLIFRQFQLWNQVSSTLLLIVVILVGLIANTFICYCIYLKSIGTKYVNPILLALSLKNILATTTCVPMAIMMLNFPSTIMRLSCDVQENITFIVLFAGYLFPMLLSIVQCDHVMRPQQHLIGGKGVVIVVVIMTVISITIGIQSELTFDDHGCHLWSIVTDAVVLTYIYSIATVVLITLVVMVTCYMMIFVQARGSQKAVKASAQTVPGMSKANKETSRISEKQQKDSAKRIVPLKRKMTTAILKPMFIIVASNIVTSFPWIILYAATVYDHAENSQHYAEVRILTMSIIYMPIAMDPVIFLTCSSKGRRAVETIIRRHRPKVTPYPTTANASRIGQIVDSTQNSNSLKPGIVLK